MPIWNRDIDRHPSAELVDTLSRHTGQTSTAIRSLTLGAYEGLLYDTLPMLGNVRFVLPMGIFHRTRRHAGMQYCPACIRESRTPYYRKRWRLALYAVCDYHGLLMVERCPECSAPVAYHRHGIGRGKDVLLDALRYCHHCMLDFATVEQQDTGWAHRNSMRRLLRLTRSFELGHWECGERTPPFGVPFFHGLHILIGLIAGRHGHALRRSLSRKMGMDVPVDYRHHREFEFQSGPTRLNLLLAACWLLDKWPDRFVRACEESRISRSRLKEDPSELPYWIAIVAEDYLDRRPYVPALEEIQSAGAYLQVRGIEVTARSLNSLLGAKHDSARRNWRIWLESA